MINETPALDFDFTMRCMADSLCWSAERAERAIAKANREQRIHEAARALFGGWAARVSPLYTGASDENINWAVDLAIRLVDAVDERLKREQG